MNFPNNIYTYFDDKKVNSSEVGDMFVHLELFP